MSVNPRQRKLFRDIHIAIETAEENLKDLSASYPEIAKNTDIIVLKYLLTESLEKLILAYRKEIVYKQPHTLSNQSKE